MSNFFDSQASNYLVSVAAKVSKAEAAIVKKTDSELLVELFNSVQDAGKIIEDSIKSIENKLTSKES
jgi:hypothetical protein